MHTHPGTGRGLPCRYTHSEQVKCGALCSALTLSPPLPAAALMPSCCPPTRHRRLVEDTAWHPVQKETMAAWSPLEKFLYKTFLGSPLKLWASVGHWAIWHFDLSK